MDDRLRIQLFHAIYGYEPLQKYALGVQKPIRIIVKNGHVTLEGVVDTRLTRTPPVSAPTASLGSSSVTIIYRLYPTKASALIRLPCSLRRSRTWGGEHASRQFASVSGL